MDMMTFLVSIMTMMMVLKASLGCSSDISYLAFILVFGC